MNSTKLAWYFEEQNNPHASPFPSPPFKVGCLLFLTGSSNSGTTLGTLRIDDLRRQRERQKISKTTTFHVNHPFWYISLSSQPDYDVKMPNFTFCGGRKQATTKFSFSF